MAPPTPNAPRAPTESWRSSITRSLLAWGAPRWPPPHPTLLAPRLNRGAPRSRARSSRGGPRDGPPHPPPPPPPPRIVALLDHALAPRVGDPEMAPHTQRSGRPGGAVAPLDHPSQTWSHRTTS